MYDIIVHHTGVEDMILDLNWSGLEKYKYHDFFSVLKVFNKNLIEGVPQGKPSSWGVR